MADDAMWRQRFLSTLVQVMACCLTAPSHYMNQCWLIIGEVLWHCVQFTDYQYRPRRKRTKAEDESQSCPDDHAAQSPQRHRASQLSPRRQLPSSPKNQAGQTTHSSSVYTHPGYQQQGYPRATYYAQYPPMYQYSMPTTACYMPPDAACFGRKRRSRLTQHPNLNPEYSEITDGTLPEMDPQHEPTSRSGSAVWIKSTEGGVGTLQSQSESTTQHGHGHTYAPGPLYNRQLAVEIPLSTHKLSLGSEKPSVEIGQARPVAIPSSEMAPGGGPRVATEMGAAAAREDERTRYDDVIAAAARAAGEQGPVSYR